MSSAAPLATIAARLARPRRRVSHLRSTTPNLVLVANANASGIAGRTGIVDGASSALRRYGARVETRLTGSVDELATLISEESRRLVLLGGDGSVHAAANVAGPKPELALMPAGKANNLARGLGIPVDLDAAARLAVSGWARPVDAILASTPSRRYVAVEGVSIGFHAYARASYRADNSADLGAGVAAALGAVRRFHSLAAAVQSDDELEVVRFGQLFVVNFPLYGPGLRVAPGADPADGLLDLVSVEATRRRELPAMLARLKNGTHLDRPGARHWQARRVRIATGGHAPIIADTTNMGFGPVDLTVAPGALMVVAPANASQSVARIAA
jgi:diacylglycerol kinase (ATP)